MPTLLPPLSLTTFSTPLTWIAMIGSGRTLHNLALGDTEETALAGLDPELRRAARREAWNPRLVARLRAYAAGRPDDFLDVPLELSPTTAFRRRVIEKCRQIPLGETVTYAELAAQAGSPGAARAVGNCMAANRIALVVPCHRVVGSGGRLCGYSACGGTALKRQILDMEAGASRNGRHRRRREGVAPLPE